MIEWSSWGQYNPCSVSCGGGTRARSRTCNNKVEGELECPGDSTQSEVSENLNNSKKFAMSVLVSFIQKRFVILCSLRWSNSMHRWNS